jgi:hypothetical protein
VTILAVVADFVGCSALVAATVHAGVTEDIVSRFTLITAMVATALTILGDVVTREVTPIIGIDGSFTSGHGRIHSATRVTNHLPSTTRHELLEAVADLDRATIELTGAKIIRAKHIRGRKVLAELLEVCTLPDDLGQNSPKRHAGKSCPHDAVLIALASHDALLKGVVVGCQPA